MRRRLINALTYPRRLILEIVDGRNCQHDSEFDPGCEDCRSCAINGECHWVTWLQSSGDLEEKPVHTLSASLRYGIQLVRDLTGVGSHDEIICACEGCAWIRLSERLVEEFEATLPPNPYREMH